jgi:hypothetical protein
VAERSKALVLGTSQKWREFESRHYQIFLILFILKVYPIVSLKKMI